MSKLERFQKIFFWLAVVCAGLGLVSSSGCSPLAALPPDALWALHPLLFAFGVVGGVLAVRRADEIDQQRWRFAEDSALTSGERKYAHKNAEKERRLAGGSFAGGPLMFGYWMAHQVGAEDDRLSADLLPVAGVVGFAVGLLLGKLENRPRDASK
jgi:hypothetical protein